MTCYPLMTSKAHNVLTGKLLKIRHIQCITRFVTPRFVNKTRFVNTFFGNENVTNRVLGGFQKAKCQINFSR